ncbi:tetratricopeptide repeat protein [Pleionea sp. CnH1-48]|uniref:tetratricopeptide repeat protein n=1 Tax=Pleionea sp. CnH1-48 TaxID=2954494 RepID=UPI002096B33B|nr:tetratricopeptide repeat protein [Pleionea sp. CnH1-48]MCO7223236.1 tetratricopeptide repeat protein [Pleionea sp. CnH1-48]
MKKVVAVVSVSSLIAACGFGGGRTLGDLEYTPQKEKKIEFEALSHKEVREEYQELLTLFKDEELKEQIERRIADVYMIEGGKKQLTTKRTKSYYADAIKSYHKILKKYPDSPDNADVLYQLAKAYEMDEKQDQALSMLEQLTTRHPNYKNNAEAHFRKGDIYFGKKQYQKAQTEYVIVTQMDDDKLKTYSHYMLGWTYYKQNRFNSSLNSFALVLSRLLANKTLEQLTSVEKPLVDDTVNSMTLAFAQSGGAEAIDNIAELQGKSYLWKIYEHLGDYYLKKERYEDSANTFRHYVTQYNFSAKAPELHSKLIDTYVKGGFPLLALKEKETYVEYYDTASQYAQVNGGLNEGIISKLKLYYDELASHYHSQAQSLVKLFEKKSKASKAKPIPEKTQKIKQDAVAAFNRAAHFYSQYINTFTTDPRVPEMAYLEAEAHFSAEKYDQAIQSFELVAYQLNHFKEAKYRSKAGYAAIVSYEKLLAELQDNPVEAKSWQAKAVESMLQFAKVFRNDKRSAAVLTNAAEYLFGLEQYQRALSVSESLISSNKKLDKQLKKTAYGIAAHSHFKLGQYQQAELNYFNQRSLIDKKTKEYKQVSERLANAIYKNSQELIETNEERKAILQLLKIKSLVPSAKVRVSAQYNAATLMLATKQWDSAITELRELISAYPKHKMAAEFPRKLAFAYEKNQAWKKAGETYLKLSKADKDPEARRTALFVAAEMFEKNKNYDTAIDLFKRYARTYEQPFVVRMEARYKLAFLYGKTKQASKKLFWLRRIIDGDKKGGEQRNDRSRWLAAWANIQYGDYFASEYRKLKLRAPLAKSLPKKNKMLKDATRRYEMAADYEILEFVTMSSFKIAELYQQLASALRRAPKPKGLNAEERKVYKEIIEEQAGPLDELAEELHYGNVERAWSGEFDQWISKSFSAMRVLAPARFDKEEAEVSYGDEIR